MCNPPLTSTKISSNFSFLEREDKQIARLGMLSERYFVDDPNTSLLKLRQFGELLAQRVAAHVGLYKTVDETQYDLLNRLLSEGVINREVKQLFGELRRTGNVAAHELEGDHRTALSHLKIAWKLSLWFYLSFHDRNFKPVSPFVPPKEPAHEDEQLRRELKRLQSELKKSKSDIENARVKAEQEAAQRLSAEELVQKAEEDKLFWETLAAEAEADKDRLAQALGQLQAQAEKQPTIELQETVAKAAEAAQSIELDEAETRTIIDNQLLAAGWEADTINIRYSRGVRPQKGKNMAIAEWPTANGPADYVLFIGLRPVATIEAKRKNKDVAATIEQAKRYSRGFNASEGIESPGGPWGEYHVPFTFSTNGRPFLRQILTKSGIWFCDVRKPTNLSRALENWYTPEGLGELLRMDEEEAHKKLDREGFDYNLQLRDYQQKAILRVEEAIKTGKRECLLAMATGTGKTKTCIALLYRFLKTQRFRRILFLVDRRALGEQASNTFHETRMENLQTFTDIYGLKDLNDIAPESETKAHIATIQGMVQRLLFAKNDAEMPKVDQYDCIIVDECHRGYLLDRELGDTEIEFRNAEDYISKYRRVLDYFDAVKVGLTATPALHTSEIFGEPIFQYSYREAVVDGWLIDHEPPIQILTELNQGGIKWEAGDEVEFYDKQSGQLHLFRTPDEIEMDVADFNKRVVTKPFNEVVCDTLAQYIDPTLPEKTLIFCATDNHADLVVDLLKKAFEKHYGSVDEDTVKKITGASDKPLELIRRYKNEKLPNVAVTVDLMTTGIDVPEICNLVFIRRVNSRILYEQMLGRATRLCSEIGKEVFRVFDAVDIYTNMESVSDMKPVVVNPKVSFRTLVEELQKVTDPDLHQQIKEQFIAKLRRKRRRMSDKQLEAFELKTGQDPEALITELGNMPREKVAQWFTQNQDLGELLDHKGESFATPLLISHHEDGLIALERGYGADGTAQRPEDYLDSFRTFITENINTIPALTVVVQRPRELTRKQLKELKLLLDQQGFSESNLKTAWMQMTNQEIAASIIGYIRQYALGDPLVPYEERVERAMKKLLASQAWTPPQRKWLERIGKQLKVETVVDTESLDHGEFKAHGGFNRLNKVFNGMLAEILKDINESLWNQSA
jgi:type I restriction enzyme R subunit